MNEVLRLEDGETLRVRFTREREAYATILIVYDSKRGIDVVGRGGNRVSVTGGGFRAF